MPQPQIDRNNYTYGDYLSTVSGQNSGLCFQLFDGFCSGNIHRALRTLRYSPRLVFSYPASIRLHRE